jgi:hypothetical protein
LSILLTTTTGLRPRARARDKHKLGLRHGAFLGVDDQQAAVGHVEGALHLARKVGVAGGVDDVDLVAVVVDRDGFGRDGNPALALEVAGVEDGGLLHLGLVVAEGVGLLKSPSTRVVLPWSTWAMMATLRIWSVLVRVGSWW